MASQDYEEFIASLHAHGVCYLVIGAHAVALHARPRATEDLDLLIEPSSGVAPVRIDLLTEIPGLTSFEAAWRDRVEGVFGKVPAYYLGLEDLIRAKEAADRPQDRATCAL